LIGLAFREREATLWVAFRRKISFGPTDHERAILMSIKPLDDPREKQVKNQEHEEGREADQRRILLDVLRTRFGALPRAAVVRIEAAGGVQIRRWAKRMLSAPTLNDVLRDG
jgi:hypothetical protein